MIASLQKPAFRHGADTPWGGDALRRVFGMDIPDDHTGEALAASTLPGLESRCPDGRTLTECAGGSLPLLLKLLDARETLSVQVHPDDAYAGANEGGKLGKTEAWLILHADPGAKLVYGLLPGKDVSALTKETLPSRLNWISVTAGDVLYIPAGMVHAIGEGILLYEIQQTSDVTYRFWDWDRRDVSGNPRPLHWQKACDVACAGLALSPARGQTETLSGGAITRYLNTPYFTLDRLHAKGRLTLPGHGGFRFLTALCEGQLIEEGGERAAFAPGDTLYIPGCGQSLCIEASGDLLMSGEGDKHGC